MDPLRPSLVMAVPLKDTASRPKDTGLPQVGMAVGMEVDILSRDTVSPLRIRAEVRRNDSFLDYSDGSCDFRLVWTQSTATAGTTYTGDLRASTPT